MMKVGSAESEKKDVVTSCLSSHWKSTNCYRVIWILAALFLFSWQFGSCILRFQNEPTASLVTMTMESKLDTPSFTICKIPSYEYPQTWLKGSRQNNYYGLGSIFQKFFEDKYTNGSSAMNLLEKFTPSAKKVVKTCYLKQEHSKEYCTVPGSEHGKTGPPIFPGKKAQTQSE